LENIVLGAVKGLTGQSHLWMYETLCLRLSVAYIPEMTYNVFSGTLNRAQSVHTPPIPQIDIIGAMEIVWRVRGKIIRSVLCNIVCNNCVQCDAHTYEQS